MAHLRNTLKKNGYSAIQIHRAFHSRGRPSETPAKPKPISTAFSPFVQNLSNPVSRMLAWHNIKTIHLPPPKTCSILRPVKDSLGLKAPGVYKIPCECGAIYISEMGCTIEECTKEYQNDIWLYHPHAQQWQNTQSTRATGYSLKTRWLSKAAPLHQQSHS
jgi:hypothetical protein